MMDKSKIDIIMVVDCSGSLKKEREDMQVAINGAITALKTHPDLYNCEVYLSLVAFDEDIRPEETFKFKPVTQITKPISFGAFDWSTNPGPALSEITIDALRRYEGWVEAGDECFHPLVFFFTDGYPFHKEDAKRKKYEADYKDAAQYIKEREAERKLLIVGCAFGEEASIPNMNLLTSKPERVLKITDRNIDRLKQFFKMIIPMTVSRTVTMTGDQLRRVFDEFNGEE